MDVHSAWTHGTDQSMNTVEMMSLEIWPESNMSCRTACWNESWPRMVTDLVWVTHLKPLHPGQDQNQVWKQTWAAERSNPARNGLHSSRNQVARFATRSGLESSFVLGGQDWKRARFGLLPPHFGPVSIPTSHPPDPIRIDAERGGRRDVAGGALVGDGTWARGRRSWAEETTRLTSSAAARHSFDGDYPLHRILICKGRTLFLPLSAPWVSCS